MHELWSDYRRSVMPAQVSDTQLRETRRAFYAGGHGILFKLIASFTPDAEPTSDDIHMMDELERELYDFAESVKRGDT